MLPIQFAYHKPSVANTLSYLGTADKYAYDWWKNVGSKDPFTVAFASEMPVVGSYLRAHEAVDRVNDYERSYGIPFSDADYPISAMYSMGFGYLANQGRSTYYEARRRYRKRKMRRFVRRAYGFNY